MTFTKNNQNITLHYSFSNLGHKNTIVFINSLGTDMRIWNGLIPFLSKNFNLLFSDKRGHGLSSTSDGDVSIDDYADDIIAIMDKCKIESAYVVGLSIGGLITYSLASRYPTRFKKLIFSNTGAKIGNEEAWSNRITQIKQQGIASISNDIIKRWVSPHFIKHNPDDTKGCVTMLEHISNLGYIQACEAIKNANYNNVIDSIKHPVMFIGGSDDAGTTPEFVKDNATKLHAESTHILDNVGHLPCIESPKKVAQLISDFCNQPYKDLSLFEQGMITRRSVLGDAHVNRAEANKTDFDNDFQEYITKNAWGSIWSRPQLTKRERSMITIALLTALGLEEELEMHIKATQNTGATIDDVKEVILHTGIYAGVPVSNGAFKIAKKVFQNLNKNQDE